MTYVVKYTDQIYRNINSQIDGDLCHWTDFLKEESTLLTQFECRIDSDAHSLIFSDHEKMVEFLLRFG